jgi:hypothetical protein
MGVNVKMGVSTIKTKSTLLKRNLHNVRHIQMVKTIALHSRQQQKIVCSHYCPLLLLKFLLQQMGPFNGLIHIPP